MKKTSTKNKSSSKGKSRPQKNLATPKGGAKGPQSKTSLQSSKREGVSPKSQIDKLQEGYANEKNEEASKIGDETDLNDASVLLSDKPVSMAEESKEIDSKLDSQAAGVEEEKLAGDPEEKETNSRNSIEIPQKSQNQREEVQAESEEKAESPGAVEMPGGEAAEANQALAEAVQDPLQTTAEGAEHLEASPAEEDRQPSKTQQDQIRSANKDSKGPTREVASVKNSNPDEAPPLDRPQLAQEGQGNGRSDDNHQGEAPKRKSSSVASKHHLNSSHPSEKQQQLLRQEEKEELKDDEPHSDDGTAQNLDDDLHPLPEQPPHVRSFTRANEKGEPYFSEKSQIKQMQSDANLLKDKSPSYGGGALGSVTPDQLLQEGEADQNEEESKEGRLPGHSSQKSEGRGSKKSNGSKGTHSKEPNTKSKPSAKGSEPSKSFKFEDSSENKQPKQPPSEDKPQSKSQSRSEQKSQSKSQKSSSKQQESQTQQEAEPSQKGSQPEDSLGQTKERMGPRSTSGKSNLPPKAVASQGASLPASSLKQSDGFQNEGSSASQGHPGEKEASLRPSRASNEGSYKQDPPVQLRTALGEDNLNSQQAEEPKASQEDMAEVPHQDQLINGEAEAEPLHIYTDLHDHHGIEHDHDGADHDHNSADHDRDSADHEYDDENVEQTEVPYEPPLDEQPESADPFEDNQGLEPEVNQAEPYDKENGDEEEAHHDYYEEVPVDDHGDDPDGHHAEHYEQHEDQYSPEHYLEREPEEHAAPEAPEDPDHAEEDNYKEEEDRQSLQFQDQQDTEDKADDQSYLQANETRDTQGQHLGQMSLQQFPLSQQEGIGGLALSAKNDMNDDKYTDLGRIHVDPTYENIDNEALGFMDEDEDIQPKDSHHIESTQLVLQTWEQVKRLGAEHVGTLLMKNMFSIQPQLLQLFSFRDQENLYRSEQFIAQSKKLVSAINKGLLACEDMTQIGVGFNRLGKIHYDLGVKKEAYNVIGKAFLLTLQMCLKDQFTPEVKLSYVSVFQKIVAYMVGDHYEEVSPNQSMTELENQILEEAKESEEVKDPSGVQLPRKKNEGLKTDAKQKDAEEEEILRQQSTQRTLEQMIINDIGKDNDKAQRSYSIDNLLTPQEVEEIQTSWQQVNNSDNDFGVQIFKNLFALDPMLTDLFSFGNAKKLNESKKLKQHGDKVASVFDKIVKNLHEPHKLVTSLQKLGSDHEPLKVKQEHYSAFGAAFIRSLEDKLGLLFTVDLRRNWEKMFSLVQSSMLGLTAEDESLPERGLTIAQINTYDYEEQMSSVRCDDSQRKLVGNDEDYLKSSDPLTRSKDKMGFSTYSKASGMTTDQIKKHYKAIFQKEVDFHHKMAYRFEKAFRLHKKMKDRKSNYNLEIIECIGEHSGYIEQDPMALFYCLFFCIYYFNEEIVEFLRALIQKLPAIEKTDKLLEYIDVYGLKRLRQNGEAINSLVYHMIFYQAVDDDLRIVYSSILDKLRFIQLRDKDALQFLNQRDYSIIEKTFVKYTTKVDLKQFYSHAPPLKSARYRRYNQAYYEEIVINHNVEERVAQNFRERFIQTKEDTFIVFEMYCKEDYEDQFSKTEKSEITHPQFVDLFQISLKNDSFKIAMLIYSLYMSASDIDCKIIDILLNSIRESTKSHEMKLFYLHEHFDVLSVFQMNQLLDIYDQVVHARNPRNNPLINSYNAIKIGLLIYRICWKIEEKQIFSLITKCSVLQAYINSSLNIYFDRQNNITVLQNYMSEPILHMTERKDSLDIMYEMNMQELLQHPVIIELLNLVYEGKYSISSTALSMSPTFLCLIDFEMLGSKRINDKLIDNISNFGDQGSLKQTSLQFNIWKQCIQQREDDEMIFTVLINFLMIILCIAIILVHNESQELMRDTFSGTIENKFHNFINGEFKMKQTFCEGEINNLLTESRILAFFLSVMSFTTVGMLTSVLQKFLTFRFRDNVTLQIKQMIFEFSVGAIGVVFLVMNSTDNYNTMFTEECSKVLAISDADTATINKIFTLRYPLEGQLSFKLIISCIVVQCALISILMLQRTRFLGELIIMLQEMITEMLKFFFTFGLIIAIFLMVGRLLLYELKKDKFYIFIDLFDAMNGNQNFDDFTKPAGQVYIASFMYIFRVLFISLLAAMFINKYKQVYTQLGAFRRFNIIQQKNSVVFDKYIGGVTMTFFPINVLMLPFVLPVLYFRNARMSDLALKLQYLFMMIMYIIIMLLLVVPMIPLLYLKVLINATYVSLNNDREDYKHQNLYTLIISIFFGPIICILSIFVDLLSVPQILLRSSQNFEHKYQGQGDQMNEKQTAIVLKTFKKIFEGSKATLYRGKTLTLGQLMDIHGKYFVLIDNMHDLICRGSKDYREALKNVQDYNMSKILSTKCSIPDKNGDFKAAVCEMDIIYNIQLDVELFNYVDVVFRKYWMGILREEIRKLNFKKQGGKDETKELLENANKSNALNDDGEYDEDEDLKKQSGIDPIEIGPDGYPLFRNPSDLMNNFFINFASIAFTDIQKDLRGQVNTQEIKRLKRYEKEIEMRKSLWMDNTVGMFDQQVSRYKNCIEANLQGKNDQDHMFEIKKKTREEAMSERLEKFHSEQGHPPGKKQEPKILKQLTNSTRSDNLRSESKQGSKQF